MLNGPVRTAAYNTKFHRYQLADLNGDGLPDLVYIDSGNQIHVLMNTGSGFGSDTPISGFTVNLDIQGLGFHLADVDGDGYPDLVYDYKSTFNVILGDGSGGFKQGGFSQTRSVSYGQNQFQLVDMNGDGRADIVYAGHDKKIHVLVSTGSGLVQDTAWGTMGDDFDNNNGVTPPPFCVSDLNGDGYPDYIYFGLGTSKSQFCVLVNNGAGFETDAPWLNMKWMFYWNYFLMGDVNGDGMPDLVFPAMSSDETSTMVIGATDTGTGFLPGQSWSALPPGPFLLADVNGDGLQDYVSLNANAPVFHLYTANGGVPDLLSNVDNGIGGKYTIQYKPSSAWPNNQKLPFILQTVSSVTASDGNGNTSSTQYAYSGGYYDLKSREFRGFSDVWKTLQDGTVTHSQFVAGDVTVGQMFYASDIYKGLMYQQSTTGPDGISVQQTNTFEDHPPSAQTHFPWLKVTDTKTMDAGGTTIDQWTTTTFSYDSYGNLSARDQKDKVHGGNERCDSIDYTAYCDTTNWLVARPATVSTLSGAGATVSSTSFSYYNGTNRVSSKTFTSTEKTIPLSPTPTTIMETFKPRRTLWEM